VNPSVPPASVGRMTTPEDDRFEPPYEGDELATLAGFLDFHRDTLLWKCAGLTPDQLRSRPLPTTTLSLHGLVRHLADVERSWFRKWVAGEDVQPIFWTEENRDLDIDPPADADPLADIEEFKAEIERVRAAMRDRPMDSSFVSRRGRTISVRWVYVHMIEEYARHNGHADLLRQAIDGVVGE
jgi:uncharacterized damage-inducible protein DinB